MRAIPLTAAMAAVVAALCVVVGVVATPEALVLIIPPSIPALLLLWASVHVPTLEERYAPVPDHPNIDDDAEVYRRAHLAPLRPRPSHHA